MTGVKREKYGRCPFCGREGALTFHHLIPRKVHRRVRFKRTFTREERQQGIAICRLCHDGIHDAYDEMTLARDFGSPARLMTDDRLRKHRTGKWRSPIVLNGGRQWENCISPMIHKHHRRAAR